MDARRFAVIGLLAAALLATGALPARAESASPFTVTDIDGHVWSSADLQGRPYLLDFSAVWCVPCQAVDDGLKDLYPSYGSRVQFLSVYLPPQNDNASLAAHRQANGLPWPIAPDPGDLFMAFGVSSIPRAFLVDGDGRIRSDWQPQGPVTADGVRQEFGAMLEALLEPPVHVVPAEPPVFWFAPAVGSSVAGVLVALALRPRKSGG